MSVCRSILILPILLFSFSTQAQETIIDSLLNEIQQSPDDTNKVKLFNKLSFEVVYTSHQKALEYAESALSLSNELNYPTGRAEALYKIGIVFMFKGEYETALDYYQKALVIFEKTNLSVGVSKSLNTMGSIYRMQGNYPKAIENYNKSLSVFESINHQEGIAATYGNFGIIYQMQGNYDKALDSYLKSLSIKEELGDKKGIAGSLSNIGSIYNILDKHDDAINYFEECLKISVEINNKSQIATSYNSLGLSYRGKDQKKIALDYLIKSLKLKEEIGIQKGAIISCNNIGELHSSIGNIDSAFYYYNKALQISEAIEDKEELPLIQVALGELHLDKNNLTDAKYFLNEGLKNSKETGNKSLIAKAYFNLSLVSEIEKDFQQALNQYKVYTHVNDSIFNEESANKIIEMKTKYETEKKEQEIKILNNQKELQSVIHKQDQIKIKNQRYTLLIIILLSLMGMSITFFLFNRYRLKQKHAKSLLEKRNVDIEIKLLRSQMNPHFIFNSLYSIQGFIINNENELAAQYLADFSTLIRSVLNNSRHSFITLGQELEALSLYLSLEQIRFDYKFDFEIKIDEKIEREMMKIPPLLIQPFVENSIIHGFSNKNEKGNIIINLEEMNNGLYCSIIDDGIGIEAANIIGQNNPNKVHQSLGIDITMNRIEIMGKELNIPTFVNISDLDSTGTKVDMLIPIKLC
ncbi:MAG: tetratricopeptide repeat protein [Cyclobacteriaceae bacterium]|nr:tetratricopeptide repeat protein [Cyclobacteriaceae bacterium]